MEKLLNKSKFIHSELKKIHNRKYRTRGYNSRARKIITQKAIMKAMLDNENSIILCAKHHRIKKEE